MPGDYICAQEPIYTQKPPKVAPISACIHAAPVFRLPPAIWQKFSHHHRIIKLAELIPWDELKDDDAAQFCKGFGASAKLFFIIPRTLTSMTRLGLYDEELVEQTKKNGCVPLRGVKTEARLP